jgi:hypothetical protein
MVQGGYNAVFTPPDSLDAHLLDTLKGGGWINDQELVWTLVREAPGRVLELESRYGCLFDRTPEGRIHQKPFAGQTHDRTIHKGDLTGIEIMNRLTEQTLARANVTVLEECRAVELLRDGGGEAGVQLHVALVPGAVEGAVDLGCDDSIPEVVLHEPKHRVRDDAVRPVVDLLVVGHETKPERGAVARLLVDGLSRERALRLVRRARDPRHAVQRKEAAQRRHEPARSALRDAFAVLVALERDRSTV